MARLRSTFSRFVTLCVVAVHVVLLPALYFGVGYVIRTSHEDLFVQHARTFARVLADEFEVGGALDSEEKTSDLLDLAIIHGEGLYAELNEGTHTVRSTLGAAAAAPHRRTDFSFDRAGDNIYSVVLPIVHAGHTAELSVGFDERPTKQRIQLALNRMLLMLAAYLVLAVSAAAYLSNRLSRPVRRLQHAARAIASGDYTQALRAKTGVPELHELSEDLEAMRRELVGVNVRLQQQIKEKELAEVRRDILEKQLRHRQRLETVGTLAGGIAHEFNNVLVPIMLFTDMALQDLPPESRSRPDLERVLTSARRAKNIVQKILTFSRVMDESKLDSMDLKAVVQEGLNLFAALAAPSIVIRAELDAHIPPVKGDPTLALDLVTNLCTNALQAMQGRNGMLTLGLRYPQQDYDPFLMKPCVEFWVQDTGHGMDAATAERIFEPFFTTRSVGEGTGLGLSVVHGIVKSFGARIAVDTKLGQGTTIKIFFPSTEDAGANEALEISA